MSFTVYAIIDPRSQRPFYVGETKAFDLRCRQHLAGTDQISGLVIRQIQENGFVPHFEVLETHANEETALRAEIVWIELMLGRGIDLLNSQAFTGYLDRKAKRQSETTRLRRMQRLRALANGRTAERTPTTAAISPPPKSKTRPSKGRNRKPAPPKCDPNKPKPSRTRRRPYKPPSSAPDIPSDPT
jgi:hypothetical protein